jgi:very-short-patch-repair endonuclease
MAAVLTCGPGAVISRESAGALWGILQRDSDQIFVSVPADSTRGRPGISTQRRTLTASDVTRHQGIPLTSPACTLIDLGTRLNRDQLEAAINQADKLDLIDPETLRAALDQVAHRPGLPTLLDTLDYRSFTLSDSGLERLLLPIARRAGLGQPETQVYVNGFKVDFYWRDLGLIVETDGLRYHRTPAQQARDRIRDQVHAAAGLTTLRFTRAQVRFEPAYVEATLRSVACRLAA